MFSQANFKLFEGIFILWFEEILKMSYPRANQPYKGFVRGVLSGNSLIINFISPEKEPYMIINLENLIAPKLGSNDGKTQDEPYAFESWDYLRKLSIGKSVLVGPIIREINDRNSKNPLRIQTIFGALKVAHSRVSIVNNSAGETTDIGMNICQAGYVKTRDANPNFQAKPNSYLSKLQEFEEEAKNDQRGIWSEEEGFVRNLPVQYKDYQILETREFSAIVDGIINGTSLQLILLPNHQYVILQIAGCRADLVNKRNPDKNSYGWKAYQENLKKFLHRTIKVRLCQKYVVPNENDNEGPHRYVGCVIGEPDKAFQKLISDGLARYDPKTSDFAPNADEYIVKEIVARAKKLGMWSTIKEEDINVNRLPTNFPTEFQGIVTRIHSSCSLEITGEENVKHIFYLNNVKVPYFYYYKSGGSETYGYEAREFLRKHYVGQQVKAVVDGCYNTNPNPTSTYGVRVYATIFHDKKCVNEEIVRSGFAVYHDSFIDRSSSHSQQIRQAEKEARDKRNGMHSSNQHENVIIDDLVNFSNQRAAQNVYSQINKTKLEGVIEHITSGGKLFVYVQSQGIYIKCGINGVICYSSTDRMASEVYKYLTQHYEQATVEIVPCNFKHEVFYSSITIQTFTGKRFDLAEELLKNGLAEINKQYIKTLPLNYISLQTSAENAGLGVWEIKTRHNYRLKPGVIEKVKLTSIWNPVKLTIQLLEKEMEHITNFFTENGANLKPIVISDESGEQLCTNDCVVVKIANNYYRARIDSFVTQQQGNGMIKIVAIKDIFLIDFCEPKKDVNNDPNYAFFYLPDELKSIESQACIVKLAFLQDSLENAPDAEINNAVKDLFSLCNEVVLYAHLVYEDDGVNVLLTDQESRNSGTLNYVVLQKNYANYVEHDSPPEFDTAKQLLANYSNQQNEQQTNNENPANEEK